MAAFSKTLCDKVRNSGKSCCHCNIFYIFFRQCFKCLGSFLPPGDHKRFDSCKLVRYQEHLGEKDLCKSKAAIMVIYCRQILFECNSNRGRENATSRFWFTHKTVMNTYSAQMFHLRLVHFLVFLKKRKIY